MATISLIDRLRGVLQAFRKADRGNVVITFALATVPIMGFVGSAVDYSRANSAKAAMQAAVDATALMLSKDASTLTSAQMNQKATAYFTALFNHPEVTGVVITPTYTTSSGSQIVVTGTGTVPTTFMKVMGVSTVNINVSSTVKWGNSRLRVALVLDNTGSMSDDGKIGALKTATNNLLTQLKTAAAQNGDVYVSIIPFVKDVNVDPVNHNATWIDWTDWNANNGTCKNYSGSSQPQTKSSCQNKSGTWMHDNHNTWNGCVTDRGNSNAPKLAELRHQCHGAVRRHHGVAVPGRAVRFLPAGGDGAQLQLVGDDHAGQQYVARTATPIRAIGLALGWMSLVGGGPFTAAAEGSELHNISRSSSC